MNLLDLYNLPKSALSVSQREAAPLAERYLLATLVEPNGFTGCAVLDGI